MITSQTETFKMSEDGFAIHIARYPDGCRNKQDTGTKKGKEKGV
jgi:hypothetical protein